MKLSSALEKLKDSSVTVAGKYVEGDFVSLVVTFSQGTVLRSDYWRIIKNGTNKLCNFDYEQKYGIPMPLNVFTEAKNELEGKVVTAARLEKESSDLTFEFTDNLKLQVFNFTGYEVWHLTFPDGTIDYSNRVRKAE